MRVNSFFINAKFHFFLGVPGAPCWAAAPSSTPLTREAKLRLQTDSLEDSRVGDTFTNIATFAVPSNESCKTCVSLELRKGMCFSFLASAAMTSPSALKLLLILCASFRRAPSASVRESRSEPAKSTKCSLPRTVCPVTVLKVWVYTVNMQWEREECSFIFVENVDLFFEPAARTFSTSSRELTGTIFSPSTALCRISRPLFAEPSANKSKIVSL
mmetsp:Transcript_33386/g.46249  ORF Transcript_33386/g.46249 Transcript_33386/m.46249 type:complete len:215 (+) Transcript_33386:131-775(+)